MIGVSCRVAGARIDTWDNTFECKQGASKLSINTHVSQVGNATGPLIYNTQIWSLLPCFAVFYERVNRLHLAGT